VGQETYGVIWSAIASDDLERVTDHATALSIVRGVDHKLGAAPTILGEPLKSTSHVLWRVKFGKFRVIYTILETEKEVVVLSIQKREIAYEQKHLDRLEKFAVILKKGK
jgi:mRNA-degrading endonuclease RelE of RelBE toxin-antitoxin system